MKEKQRDNTQVKQSTQYRLTIDSLKTETKKLKEQLCLDTLQQTNIGLESEIARLQEQGDAYVRKIEFEKKKIQELDGKIATVHERINLQRANMGGVHGAKETSESISRKIKSLENKLDKSLQKYNQAVAQNRQLREQIDKLRKERVVYDNIYKKLEEELQQKKFQMKEIIEKGKRAHEYREEAKNKMNKLKQQAEKEQEEFENEWRELGQLIEKDKKVKDFIKQQDQTGNISEDIEDVEDSAREGLTKKVAKSAWHIAKDRANIQVSLEKVELYEDAFKKIEEATGISDIDQLINTFVEAENNNYSLFNYVNELSNDMEKLEMQITDIKSEIEKYKGSGVSTDNQRKRLMKELEQKLERTEVRVKEYEKKHNNTNSTVDSLKAGILALYQRLECPHPERLNELTEDNMMQFLGTIERRTNEILQMYSVCEAATTSPVSGFLGSGISAQISLNKKIELEPPSVPEREPAEDDESAMPMNKEELRVRALKRLTEDDRKIRKK